jgi:Tfp pilus assembly protein PilN
MRAVNLLPANAYAAKQRVPHAPVVLSATVPLLAGALVYLGYAVEHSQVVNRQATLASVQSQIAELAPSQAVASESAQVASVRAGREAALADVLGKRVAWDAMFSQLSRVMPGGAWLTQLNASSPTPSASASTTSSAPTGVSIQGYAISQAVVAHVLQRLSLVPALSNVTVVSSTAAQSTATTLVQFSFTASMVAS